MVGYRFGAQARLMLATSAMVLVMLAGAAPIHAQDNDPELSPELEAQATQLDKQIMCPVCPSETLNQSQATLAKQMRAIIRQRLAQGQSPQEITDYFVSVYGRSVLAEPPTSGFGLAVWLMPPVALAAGVLALVFILRSMRRRPTVLASAVSQAPPRAEGAGMAAYLKAVDEELGGDTRSGGVRE